jgi:hypothetical protein
MNASFLASVGKESFKCPKSKIKFWIYNGNVWATFHNSRWDFLRDTAICWGKQSKIANIIDYQIDVFSKR